MHFTTPVAISKTQNPIGYGSEIMSLGSCFAINIAAKFDYFKFTNYCNPFGILFHPLAISEMVRKMVSKEYFTEADVFFHNDLWHCFDVHSDLSHPDKEKLLYRLNDQLESAHLKIRKATHLIITYGTAWVYRNKTSQKLVANCHKLPQSQFEKELLPIYDIQNAIAETIGMIQNSNPNCSIIFTISPVRHIKDAFVGNQRSKAHLIAALHDTLSNLISENGLLPSYFPSYEIVMDELRDYRFYTEDMLHPNQIAIDYIWDRFAETHISMDDRSAMHEIDSIQKALQHKPFHPQSESHALFVSKLHERIKELQRRFPHLSF